RMNREKFTVKTIEVTHAVRSTRLSGLNIEKEQAIGFVDGELLAVADKTGDVITDLFAKLDLDSDSVVTIYYGADTELAEAEDVAEAIRQQYPMLEVDVVDGGQPHYNYIVSVE
ncbi:MAG: DAK2 domain-containing protein, partial [Dehalococcoidales bacterium]